MRRQITGLRPEEPLTTPAGSEVFLVQVERVYYQRKREKPFFALSFGILEPPELAGKILSGRLYCTPKALWKLRWFLRDFGYDSELWNQEIIDEKFLLGLRGVVKISHTNAHGRSFFNLDAFAPAAAWEDLSAGLSHRKGPCHDL